VSQDILLRDGRTTRDRRLDRLAQYDERNATYGVRALLGEAPRPLRSYTWSVPVCFDQGSEGECVAYGIAHSAVARPRRLPVDQLTQVLRSKNLYHRAQQLDPWDGGRYPGAHPQYDGTSVLAGMQAARELGLFGSYHWANTEREVAEAVGYRGPVVIGVNWYAGMADTDADGFIEPTGEVLGGHCVILHAFSLRTGTYRVLNSWGPGWGIAGGAKLRRQHLQQLLGEAGGEACLPVRRTA
jgi:hypothetical protein